MSKPSVLAEHANLEGLFELVRYDPADVKAGSSLWTKKYCFRVNCSGTRVAMAHKQWAAIGVLRDPPLRCNSTEGGSECGRLNCTLHEEGGCDLRLVQREKGDDSPVQSLRWLQLACSPASDADEPPSILAMACADGFVHFVNEFGETILSQQFYASAVVDMRLRTHLHTSSHSIRNTEELLIFHAASVVARIDAIQLVALLRRTDLLTKPEVGRSTSAAVRPRDGGVAANCRRGR